MPITFKDYFDLILKTMDFEMEQLQDLSEWHAEIDHLAEPTDAKETALKYLNATIENLTHLREEIKNEPFSKISYK